MLISESIEVLKLDTEAIRIRFLSEPYVTYTVHGYQPAADVLHLKKRRKLRLFLSAKTLGTQLESIRIEDKLDGLLGIEVWISKASDERRSPYVLAE